MMPCSLTLTLFSFDSHVQNDNENSQKRRAQDDLNSGDVCKSRWGADPRIWQKEKDFTSDTRICVTRSSALQLQFLLPEVLWCIWIVNLELLTWCQYVMSRWDVLVSRSLYFKKQKSKITHDEESNRCQMALVKVQFEQIKVIQMCFMRKALDRIVVP